MDSTPMHETTPPPLSPNPLPAWQRRVAGPDAEGIDARAPVRTNVAGPGVEFPSSDPAEIRARVARAWRDARFERPAAAPPLTLNVVRLHTSAVLPSQAHPDSDAGWDLTTIDATTLYPTETVKFRTGLAIAVPPGYCARIMDRSGMGASGIHVFAGLVDSGFTNEWLVVLHNAGTIPREIKAGDRVAQFVLLPVIPAGCREVESLGETSRGIAGFGSTGR